MVDSGQGGGFSSRWWVLVPVVDSRPGGGFSSENPDVTAYIPKSIVVFKSWVSILWSSQDEQGLRSSLSW